MGRHFGLCGSSGSDNPGMDIGFHPSLVQRRRERFGGILMVQSVLF